MNAHETFTHALLALADAGKRTPCQGPQRDLWTSDNDTDRADAAERCTPCPVLALCANSADELGEKWMVYGGTDRRPARPPKKGKNA